MFSSRLVVIGALVSTALGQQVEWGQCGGLSWTGATTCASGLVCVVQNVYYSQCLPGTSTTTSTTSTTSKTSTSSSSTATTLTTLTTSTSSVSHTSTSSTAQPTSTGWQYFVTFGDSYSQTGFDITLTKASAGNILGNPTFPGWTTTDGYNWIDYLIATYNKTLVLSYNFAYGGATTDASLVEPYESTVLSFVNQTQEFSANLVPAPTYAPWMASNTLFGVWMGVNDVGNGWYVSGWSTLAGEIIARYMSQVQVMYDAGARNFLFLTVPPIQYTPLVVAEGTATQADVGDAVVYYNSLLSAAVTSFKSANTGVTAYVYDTTTPFMEAIDNPTAYGSPDATCYNADGVSCLWYNNYHPGQAIHKLIAEGISSLTGI